MKKSVKITLAVLFPAIFAASCILGGVLAYKKYSRKTVDVSATVTEDEWVNAVEKTSLAANFTFDQRNLTIRKNKIPGSGFTNETEKRLRSSNILTLSLLIKTELTAQI